MICSKCGANNADGTRFCQNCGNDLYAPQGGNFAPAQSGAGFAAEPATPAQSALKRFASSPLFLAAAIAYSAAALFSMLFSSTANGAVMAQVYRIINELGLNPDIAESIRGAMRSRGSGVLSVSVTSALIVAGLWMIYASAKNRLNKTVKTGGLTMIKVVSVIGLVFVCIAAVAMVVALILVLIGAGLSNGGAKEYSRYFYSGDLNIDISGIAVAVIIVLLVFAVAAIVFSIVYFSKLIGTVNTVKRMALTGSSDKSVSAFVGVVCFISGGTGAINAISSAVMLNGFAALAELCGAAASIIFGVLIFKFRAEQKSGFSQAPVYAGAGVLNGEYKPPVQPSAPVAAPREEYAPAPAGETPVIPIAPEQQERPEQPEQPRYVFCPNCGAKCDGADFCPTCGNKLK